MFLAEEMQVIPLPVCKRELAGFAKSAMLCVEVNKFLQRLFTVPIVGAANSLQQPQLPS